MSLLEGGVRARIGNNPKLKALMLQGTLTRQNKSLSGGRWVNTPQDTAVLGFLDARRTAVMMGEQRAIQAMPERIAVILGLGPNGDVVPEPKPLDVLLIQGETHAVKTVERDPAGATWTCTLTEVGA